MIEKSVLMTCDRASCPNTVRSLGEYATIATVLSQARSRGWAVSRHNHLCPDHRGDR